MYDERTHHYHYDSQHRLVFYTRIQHGEPQVESRYLYDPLGRRTGKRVWRRERDLTGWMSLSRKPEVTWYGWDGDRLTTIQTDTTRIQTVYQPGSFTPLIRIETENGELHKAQRRSLAEKLQQEGSEDGHGVVFPAELVRLLDRLEEEIRADRVSHESRQWLAQCGLTVEQLARQMEPEYTPVRNVHLYHCDHRGLPLALISEDGNTVWSAEYDEWGNQLNQENPHHLYQPYRLPGQQHDEESGLYYNRHRYYDPIQGMYITQDPTGLAGGWNLYQYPLNPVLFVDPMGLNAEKCASIERRIENLQKEIWDKRYPDLKNDPRGLPYKAWPGSALRDTVQGHEILITIALRNLDNAWKEWHDNGCGGNPPASPTNCPATEEKENKSVENVAKTGAVAVGLYVGYKIVRAALVSVVATPVAGAASLAVP
ncbi:hypothetical protein G163CM_33310 [Pseudocitrobacter corydidari]|uniref:RHS protein conserved region domain-containing protein n=1 Tax=Pseudocitrobacter corydidari TaxID=2891570 RepID=A0ABY3S771_9ENTR|nr:hypothetical protein G163CM_33310 [Pseudocitrobacter corydidari]